MKTLLIYGGGGHAREVASYAECLGLNPQIMADDAYLKPGMFPRSQFNPDAHRVVVAIGDCASREKMAAGFPEGTEFASIIHPSAVIGQRVTIGPGAMIGPGVVVTTDVTLGAHVVINPCASVAHDCVVGDCVFIAGGARLSGNCTIGDRTWVGVNAAIRERLTVCGDVMLGMGAVVVRPITEPGTYVGVPARRIAPA